MQQNKKKKKIAYRIPLVNRETGQRISVVVFEPENDDEEAADPRHEIFKTAEKCWGLISKDESARETVRGLVDAGCDWVQLLWCVDGFCQDYESPGREFYAAFSELSKELRSLSKRIAKFESKMLRWESIVKEFNDEITDLTCVDLASHAPNFEEYRAALRLAEINSLPSGKKPHTKEENASYLYHLLVKTSGKPHFKEIAYLIEERLKRGETKGQLITDLTAENIRDMVKRFKSNDPVRFMSLLQGVKFGLKHVPRDWHTMPTIVEGAD